MASLRGFGFLHKVAPLAAAAAATPTEARRIGVRAATITAGARRYRKKKKGAQLSSKIRCVGPESDRRAIWLLRLLLLAFSFFLLLLLLLSN